MKYIVTLIAGMAVFMANKSLAQTAFSEDFEGVTTPALPASWENKKTGTIGWQTHTGSITFPGSGVDWSIKTHTQYAVVNDWNNATDINNPSSLLTPLIDMSALTVPYLSFDYYFVSARVGSNVETFAVQASTDSGKSWTTIKSVTAGDPYEWQKAYIDLAAYIGEDSLMLAFTYSDKGAKIIGVTIDNIKVYDPPANDIAITAVTPAVGSYKEYGVANSNINIAGEVFNEGSSSITSYTVHYQPGTGPVVSTLVNGVNIAPFTSANFSATPWTVPTANGPTDIKVWVELSGDTNTNNDSDATQIISVPFMPKKKILAEEGTGTWCGWCPRGAVYMDSIAHSSTHSNSFSLVAVHNNDPMVVTAYDNKIGGLIGGYPSMAIDRRLEVDPSELYDVYAEHKDNFGYADITLTDVSAAGFNYSLKVTVKPAVDLNGDYRLALALTEDDVTGTGNGWEQANYYSYQSQNIPLSGAGLDWKQEPNPVSAEKMRYNHVARAIIPSPDGAAGSLPATMTAGTTYDYTFNTITQPFWHRYNENMHAVVMLIRASDGHVLNSNNIVVPLGLSDVDAGINNFRVSPNPANSVAYVNFSLEGNSDVKVIVTDAIGRTVNIIEKNDLEAGMHRLNIDMSQQASGVYNVTLQTESGKISARLSVVK